VVKPTLDMALFSVGLGAELFAPKRRFMVGRFFRVVKLGVGKSTEFCGCYIGQRGVTGGSRECAPARGSPHHRITCTYRDLAFMANYRE
jgi:hypothetical protein